jgi:hypothetical protein
VLLQSEANYIGARSLTKPLQKSVTLHVDQHTGCENFEGLQMMMPLCMSVGQLGIILCQNLIRLPPRIGLGTDPAR